MKNANKCGDTPLTVAVQNGKLDIFGFLMKIGVDINIRNTKNDTDFI